MSYWGWFSGELVLSRSLTPSEATYLEAFIDTRRMKRDPMRAEELPDPARQSVGLPIGIEGGYFVGATDPQGKDSSVVDGNRPPLGQPSLWCHLLISDDNLLLYLDETDHLDPETTAEWIEYVIAHFLKPWGIELSGSMSWEGEHELDTGVIIVDKESAIVQRGLVVTGTDGEPRRLKVFLCHASEDKPAARRLKKKLVSLGVDPWLDEDSILAGEEWEEAIRVGLRTSDAVVIILSEQAVKKIGYVQREVRTALMLAEERPHGSVYIIPMRLDNCDVPVTLAKYQVTDLFKRGYVGRLEKTLRAITDQLNR